MMKECDKRIVEIAFALGVESEVCRYMYGLSTPSSPFYKQALRVLALEIFKYPQKVSRKDEKFVRDFLMKEELQ